MLMRIEYGPTPNSSYIVPARHPYFTMVGTQDQAAFIKQKQKIQSTLQLRCKLKLEQIPIRPR